LETTAAGTLGQAELIVTQPLRRVLFVGAFPATGSAIHGGMITSCRILMASSFPSRFALDLFDSTQISNPPPAFAVRLLRAGARFVRFIGRFESRRPDVVLLFVAVGGSILEKGAMAWYARLRGVPAILFPRGGSVVNDCRDSAFTRTWVRWSFRGARKIVCQSESWKRFAIDVLGFARGNVTVIRNWTATRDLLDIGAKRVARQDSFVRLLFLGWLDREKGIFELIEACRRLAGNGLFTLDIAGEGDVSAEARALVLRHDLSEVVRFRGWLRGQDLRQALSAADVLVLPSWAEGLPNAMVEAMAARLAVVVTGVGAIPELITDCHSGMLVEPRNPDSLARALEKVILDGEFRENLAREAYEIAVREFEVEAAVDRLVQEIEQTVVAGREQRLCQTPRS
jgi:glycosyltransferase involved in cell wall biosynthesis